MLWLYNTLTRRKDAFVPLDPANVRMYVCGPTVYDCAHIGNARPLIVFDGLFRLLRHLYGADHVTYVRNITDVDDKINARAAERGITIRALTEETARIFHADVAALGCLEPTVEPRATDHIQQMIEMIARLIAGGHAYEAQGHVLFSVPSMPDYGALSRRPLDEMIAGARVDVAPYKRGDMDFVLWKPSKEGEPAWDSPWGRGRPGWHIECSAMSWKYLGETFDIHGGGIDLVFPHHENEIAQTRCAFGHKVMANVWMHNGFLQVEGEKMSKSLGNFVTIRELLTGWQNEPWAGSIIRFAMLGTHYRQPIDWRRDRLTAAKGDIQALAAYTGKTNFANRSNFELAWQTEHTELKPSAAVMNSLRDDLNTAEAISHLQSSISRILSLDDESRVQLVHDARFLGLIKQEQREWLTGSMNLSNMADSVVDAAVIKFRDYRVFGANNDVQHSDQVKSWFTENNINVESPERIVYSGTDPTRGKIERLIEARNAARAAKNWAEADRIRDELAAMGVVLKDNKNGTTTWEVRR